MGFCVYIHLCMCVCFVARAVAHVCKYAFSVATTETLAASKSRQNNLAQHSIYIIYGKLLLIYVYVYVYVHVCVFIYACGCVRESVYNDHCDGMCIVCVSVRVEGKVWYMLTS